MSEDKPILLDLNIPRDCKTFLKSIKVDGKEVTELTLKGGRKLKVDDMTDEELILYANELYLNWFKGKEGGFVDTHIRTGTN